MSILTAGWVSQNLRDEAVAKLAFFNCFPARKVFWKHLCGQNSGKMNKNVDFEVANSSQILFHTLKLEALTL
ncbi:MAG: hypothetical protein Ta2B_21990 [Termitinemataceae bacterium]|nr:MAG: hypothetical protein Ta2B_21990 [Termitinemataceae bacterium]